MRRKNRNIVFVLEDIRTLAKTKTFNHYSYFYDSTVDREPGPTVEIVSDYRWETIVFESRAPLSSSDEAAIMPVVRSRSRRARTPRPTRRFHDVSDGKFVIFYFPLLLPCCGVGGFF